MLCNNLTYKQLKPSENIHTTDNTTDKIPTTIITVTNSFGRNLVATNEHINPNKHKGTATIENQPVKKENTIPVTVNKNAITIIKRSLKSFALHDYYNTPYTSCQNFN